MSHPIRALCLNVLWLRFFEGIHLIICSHEHKVQNHHMIQTQIAHRECVITFLKKKKQMNKDIIKIN